jgi:predicted alpha/beta hydrolase
VGIRLLLPRYYLLVALAAALGATALTLAAEALAAGAEAAAGALAGAAAIVAIENKLNATAVINFVIIILRVSGGWW